MFGKKLTPGPLEPKKGPYGRSGAVFWPPGRILARKSVFCYKTLDFVNVTLDNIFDLAPSDRFLVAVWTLGGPFLATGPDFGPKIHFLL